MNISESNLDRIDREKWNELVDTSSSSTPFCEWGWLQLMESGFRDWHVHCVVAEDEGCYLGCMPLVVRAAPGLRQSHSMAHGSPAGPLLAPGADPELAGRIIAWWADRHSACWRAIRLSVTFDGDQPPGIETLHSRDFRIKRQTAYRIPLDGRSFEDWGQSLCQQTRNKNRQALERGGTFEVVESPDAAPELARLAGMTAGRHSRDSIPYGEQFYRALLDKSGPLAASPGLARVVMVRVDGRPAAYNLCVAHRGRMWLIDHGADSSTFEARPNNLIYRQIVKGAFEEGLREIDLGAVPENGESLARFKQGLDGQPCHRLSVIKTNLPFRLAHRASSLLGRLGGSGE